MNRIPLFRTLQAPDVLAHVADAIQPDDEGRIWVGEGPTVKRFERALENATQEVGWLATNSCTGALYLALHAIGVGPGDEVVTTPMTCSLTNSVVTMRGARPIWADVDPRTGLIDPVDVARKVTRRTKAVLAVDFGGRRCNYAGLRRAAPGVPIVEDAAHLAPEPLGDERGDWVALSFQAIKFLNTTDGGALLAPQERRTATRLLRWAGLDRESRASFRASQQISEPGGKWHMTDVAAAFGLANLPLVPDAVARHRVNAAFYGEAFGALRLPGIEPPPPDPYSTWWLYVLLADSGVLSVQREPASLIAHLAERGIEASPVHRRNDVHPGFYYPNGPLPGVDRYAPRQVAIPVHWGIMDEDRQRVVDAVAEWALGRA